MRVHPYGKRPGVSAAASSPRAVPATRRARTPGAHERTRIDAHQAEICTTDPSEKPMTPSTELATTNLTAHLPALRAALEEQRCFRLTQLEELDAGADAGAADDARGEVAAAVKLAAQAALADINTALHRLDEGSYGRCERCGTAIPLERLEILPMSRLCMPCQHAKETGRAAVTANTPTPRPHGQRGGQQPTRRQAGR